MKATLVQPRCVLKPDHQTYTRDVPVPRLPEGLDGGSALARI